MTAKRTVISGSLMVMGILLILVMVSLIPSMFQRTFESGAIQDTTVAVGVTTYAGAGLGNRTANVTLDESLFNDSLTRVVSITASGGNVTDGTLTAGNITNNGRTLRVDGLTAAGNRTLTVVYEYDVTSTYTGAGPTIQAIPVFVAVAVLVFAMMLIVVPGYMMIQSVRNR
jgi:hypothetical protein